MEEIIKAIEKKLILCPANLFWISQNQYKNTPENDFTDTELIYLYLEEKKLTDFIRNNFFNIEFSQFLVKFMEKSEIYIDGETAINYFIKDINSKRYNIDPNLNRIPPNHSKGGKSHQGGLNVDYNVKINNKNRSINFKISVGIQCSCNHYISTELKKNTIISNLKKVKWYRFSCNKCKREFRVSPNLRRFEIMNPGNDLIEERDPLIPPSNIESREPENKVYRFDIQIKNERIKMGIINRKTEELPSGNISLDNILSEIEIKTQKTRKKKKYPSSAKWEKFYQDQQVKLDSVNINLNTEEIRCLIFDKWNKYNGILEKLLNYVGNDVKFQELNTHLQNKPVEGSKNFLFKLVRIAGIMLPFDEFCVVLKDFSSKNGISAKKEFAKRFSETAPKMFRNMILHNGRTGINFPVKNENDLKEKLRLFNSIENIQSVSSKDILEDFLVEFKKNKVNYKQLMGAIPILMRIIKSKLSRARYYIRIGNMLKSKGYKRNGERYVKLGKKMLKDLEED